MTAKASLRQDSSAYGKTLQRKLQAQRFLALNDQSLAKSLQDGEERSRPKRVDGHAELLAMNKTIQGKSVLLVDGVNKVISEFNNSNPKLNSMDIKPVAKEDIVYFMERMLETQAQYKRLGYWSNPKNTKTLFEFLCFWVLAYFVAVPKKKGNTQKH